MNWRFEIIKNWDEIWSKTHLKRWEEHMNSSPSAHVFSHPALVKAWVETYLSLRNISPLFIWAQNKDLNVVFFPLVLWKRNWKSAYMRSIVPVGYSDYDYHDPIFSQIPDSEQINEFWHSLHAQLEKECSFDEFALDGIHENYAPSELQIIRREACPYISLTEYKTLNDYHASLSSKLRNDLRRTMNRIQEHGKFEILTYSENTLNAALGILPTLLDYHRKRWPNAYKAPHFHENVVRYGSQSGILHFTQLNLDDIPMSWIIGFIYKGSYNFWMPVMNASFSQYSPGKINLQHCIKYALENNLKKYDHLRGDELYKSKLTDKHSYIISFSYKSNSFRRILKERLLSIKGIIKQ